jgi:ATP phosphoribosyltransferase regulatory subunit
MVAESVQSFEALESQAAILLDVFKRAGYEQVAPSIIQPADVFLDHIGEEIRNRTYVFTDLSGDELCLRPDLTLPVSRLYLERHPNADEEARYCYNGSAFRFQLPGHVGVRPREFRQAGIECFGDSDRESCDVEVVVLTIEAVRKAGLKNFRLLFGDIGMFLEFLNALALPDRWRRKLRHYFWRPAAFHALLSRLAGGEAQIDDGPIARLIEKIALAMPERSQDLVATYLEVQGFPIIGSRTLAEISERLLDRATDLQEPPLEKGIVDAVNGYLAISGPPRQAAEQAATIAKSVGIELVAAEALMRHFDQLTQFGIDSSQVTFSAEFGRSLEYYSGPVFQIESTTDPNPIGGGGRYDELLSVLGAGRPVPAAGAAIHTERLLAAIRCSE